VPAIRPPLLAIPTLMLALLVAVAVAPFIDAKLLDGQFAINRHWFPQTVAQDVLVVGIDDAFADSVEEPLALSHRYLAEFLLSASEAGATVIGLDIVLPQKRYDTLVSTSNPDMDFHRILLAAVMQARQRSKLVVAKIWDHDRRHYVELQTDFAAVLSTQEQVQGAASALVCTDADGRVRRYPGAESQCQPDGTAATLSSEMAAAMGKRQGWSGLINFQIGAPFQYLPIQEVLRLARAGERAKLRALFQGKAVLLGSVQADIDLLALPAPLAAWLPDTHRVPGVLVHAQSVRSMLNQGLIAPVNMPLQWALALSFGLFWRNGAFLRKFALLLGLSILLLVASNVLLRQGVWLAPAAMLLIGWTCALGRTSWQSWVHFRDKQRLSRTFSGYVSPGVLKQILDGGIDAHKSGNKLQVCVMFTDIRGFTTLSEHLPAEQVVALLNRYFARMTAVVHQHGGTVDKFIGDGMMAFFGAPNPLASPERAALAASADMLEQLAELNRELLAEGTAALDIGIGLHAGPAVIGHIGSADRHEYTAIGDTVNIAARLEGLCKSLGYPVICSVAVAERLEFPAELKALGAQALKGRADLAVYGWAPGA
jgi:adenylate cyclase